MDPRKAAVIGYPVAHSLSPRIHGYWLRKHHIEGEYGLLETKPEEFETTLKSLAANGYCGVNVTVPFKERACAVVDNVEEVARMMGAVNTVVVKPDGSLWGTNTDAYGFIQNIRSQIPGVKFAKKKVMVLGAGGAARAVIYGLLQEGVSEILVTNRTQERAEILQKLFGSRVRTVDWQRKDNTMKGLHFLVNTTVLGMEKQPPLEINLKHLPPKAVVVDIVYRPLETDLLKQAKQKGHKTVDGLGMLFYQAVRGFELFFGTKPEVTSQLRAEVNII
jgi:shikimate dehydrogenase